MSGLFLALDSISRLAVGQKTGLFPNSRITLQRAGFQLIDEDRHKSFGKELVGQTWIRELWYFRSTCAPAADTPVNASFRLGGV